MIEDIKEYCEKIADTPKPPKEIDWEERLWQLYAMNCAASHADSPHDCLEAYSKTCVQLREYKSLSETDDE